MIDDYAVNPESVFPPQSPKWYSGPDLEGHLLSGDLTTMLWPLRNRRQSQRTVLQQFQSFFRQSQPKPCLQQVRETFFRRPLVEATHGDANASAVPANDAQYCLV